MCIVCRQEKEGSPVLDDPYIKTVRAIKTRLGIAAGNRLVVCKEDIPKWREKRKRFEKYVMWFAFLSFVFFVSFILVSPSIAGFAYMLVGIILVMAIPLLTYSPGIRDEKAEEPAQKNAGKPVRKR